jgi:hypothetical protein
MVPRVCDFTIPTVVSFGKQGNKRQNKSLSLSLTFLSEDGSDRLVALGWFQTRITGKKGWSL